jgi:hypothetical protein
VTGETPFVVDFGDAAGARRLLGEARFCAIFCDSCGERGPSSTGPARRASTRAAALATINAWTRLSSKPSASCSRVLKRAKRTLTENAMLASSTASTPPTGGRRC